MNVNVTIIWTVRFWRPKQFDTKIVRYTNFWVFEVTSYDLVSRLSPTKSPQKRRHNIATLTLTPLDAGATNSTRFHSITITYNKMKMLMVSVASYHLSLRSSQRLNKQNKSGHLHNIVRSSKQTNKDNKGQQYKTKTYIRTHRHTNTVNTHTHTSTTACRHNKYTYSTFIYPCSNKL